MEINSKTNCKHVLRDIEALERVCFFQEVSRKLFAICVHCHGGVLYVSIQVSLKNRIISLVKINYNTMLSYLSLWFLEHLLEEISM